MNIRNRWTTRAAACLRRRLSQVRTEDGFTIIEVIVSAAMCALMAGAVFTGLEASGQASSQLRKRSQADDLAQQDQQRMRGMTIGQLTQLSQTRTEYSDGTKFTVDSSAKFVNGGSGSGSCQNAKADFVKVTSTVSWPDESVDGSTANPVTTSSVISPPVGGTLLVRVADDQTPAVGQPGVTVQAISGADRFTAVTDSDGCAYFAGTSLGAYFVIASKTGWVKPNYTNPTDSAATLVSTSAADTTTVDLTYAQGGVVTANFKSKLASGTGTATVPGESPALTWRGGTMSGPMSTPATSTATPSTSLSTPLLFPFHNGGTTTSANYEVWGGKCTTDPVTVAANKAKVTADPGATGSTPQDVYLPGLNLTVKYGTSLVASTLKAPAGIKISDSCGDAWNATVNPAATTVSTGALLHPGQPAGTLAICASYNAGGAVGTRHTTITGVANNNFTTGTSKTILITPTSAAGSC